MDPFPSFVAVACCWLLPSLLWLYQLRPRLARALVVECLATATFKFCAACVTLLAAHGQLDSLRSTAAGLLTTWVGIVCLAFPSGGHLNSAVTAGFWAAGQLCALDALLYVGAQIAGCALAMDVLRLAAPVHLHSALGPMKPASAETLLMAFVLEVAATALNVFLALSCGVFGTHKAMATATLVVLLVISGKLVLPGGTSMDPSGAFAGAFFARQFEYLEIYWAATLLGAVLAGSLYSRLQRASASSSKKSA
mmetsp:Transcript_12230/g.29158  ORF Transcript_12230/g.29158 Transcript_12230/m.29158 type:complete len:252 (+) Transcript_12230:76-831(+)